MATLGIPKAQVLVEPLTRKSAGDGNRPGIIVGEELRPLVNVDAAKAPISVHL